MPFSESLSIKSLNNFMEAKLLKRSRCFTFLSILALSPNKLFVVEKAIVNGSTQYRSVVHLCFENC